MKMMAVMAEMMGTITIAFQQRCDNEFVQSKLKSRVAIKVEVVGFRRSRNEMQVEVVMWRSDRWCGAQIEAVEILSGVVVSWSRRNLQGNCSFAWSIMVEERCYRWRWSQGSSDVRAMRWGERARWCYSMVVRSDLDLATDVDVDGEIFRLLIQSNSLHLLIQSNSNGRSRRVIFFRSERIVKGL